MITYRIELIPDVGNPVYVYKNEGSPHYAYAKELIYADHFSESDKNEIVEFIASSYNCRKSQMIIHATDVDLITTQMSMI